MARQARSDGRLWLATATEIEARLALPRPDAALEALLGTARHDELRALLRAAPRRPAGRTVFILPGIMGSTLGRARKLLPDDLLWFDPVEIALGHLSELVPPSTRVLEPRGALLFGYLRLRLTLRAAGHDARFFAYDWRHSAREAAAALAERLAAAPAGSALVAHSLGGIVARAVLAQPEAARLAHVVQLGAPNRGAYAAVQALRGSYPLVRRLAQLDLAHDAAWLAREVFAQFVGLAELLPEAGACDHFDPFDADQWPPGPRPTARVLAAALAARMRLPPPDARFTLIAAVGHDTPAALRLAGGTFEFATSLAGDGTVPLELARLPGLTTYYATARHGELPSDGAVTRAVLDLLEGNATNVLSTHAPVARRPHVFRRESLAGPAGSDGKVFWDDLAPEEQLSFLREFVAPAPVPDAAAETRRLSPANRPVALALEAIDVTRVRADALVLALFTNVDPAGATLAVDAALGGAIRDLAAHRALGAAAGEVFVLPVPRGRLGVRHVVLAGLGEFSRHDALVRRRAAANALRALALSGIRDCAFVLWATASGVPPAESAMSLAAGFADALVELDPALRPRRLTLVSRSVRRLREARHALEASLPGLAGGAALRLLPAPSRTAVRRKAPRPAAAIPLCYLFVQERADELSASLLGPADKGTVLHATRRLERRRLETSLAGLGNELSAAGLAEAGEVLAELLLPGPVRAGLAALKGSALVVVHDAAAARWPWEALHVDGHAPAAAHGLCRRFAAEGLSVARWIERRSPDDPLSVLLVTNPTEDLPGAAREGVAVRAALARIAGAVLTEIPGREATRSRLLTELRSGRYQVVHYAGHAFFEPDSPGRSGILCAGGRVLPGADLAEIESLPALMFFNACESGRIRARGNRRAALERGAGLAETFLRAGLANYVGTWWPVGDAAALEFARSLYGRLAAGSGLGEAMLAARIAVRRKDSGDWANYLHYGGYEFRLRDP